MLDTGSLGGVWAIAFHPDRKHLLGGGEDGIRRWLLPDGEEVGKQTAAQVLAISVSRDRKWIVRGTNAGASVWDAEMLDKVVDVEGTAIVSAVDVSPDSTRFATGTGSNDNKASVWSITSGKRLIGPLKHDITPTGVRFSPNGEHVATSCPGGSVRIFDSHTGDQLLHIKANEPSLWSFSVTPLVWSNDGQQIFTITDNNKIKSFAFPEGSQLAESPIRDNTYSISLAGNGKFIATVAADGVSFLDTSTLTPVGTAIQDSEAKWSTPVSLDSDQIATGRRDGKVIIYNLADFLPDSYGPFQVSICPFIMLACRISTVPSLILTHYVRHLLARSLRPRVAMTINHLTLSL